MSESANNGIANNGAYLAPHLVVANGEKAIEFYTQVLGAKLIGKQTAPNSPKISHAALEIYGSTFFLCDDFPEFSNGRGRTPHDLNGSPVTLHIQSSEADAIFERATKGGAVATFPIQDMFWGDRYGKFVDPFGHEWSVGQKIKQLTDKEIEAGAKEAFSKAGKGCD